MTAEERGWLRLHLTRGLGRVGMIRLMDAFGSLPAVLAASATEWRRRAGIREAVAADFPADTDQRLSAALRLLEKSGARILSLWDKERYPSLLRSIHDPPALLYVRGALPACDCFAVVGARQASATGRQLTREICREMASRGVAIVSGLARGIDTAAHLGAMEGQGMTVGVLGCGIDRVYPPENLSLFRQVEEQGALLSEYPPGTPPLPGHFPGRNRIITGLCRGVPPISRWNRDGKSSPFRAPSSPRPARASTVSSRTVPAWSPKLATSSKFSGRTSRRCPFAAGKTPLPKIWPETP